MPRPDPSQLGIISKTLETHENQLISLRTNLNRVVEENWKLRQQVQQWIDDAAAAEHEADPPPVPGPRPLPSLVTPLNTAVAGARIELDAVYAATEDATYRCHLHDALENLIAAVEMLTFHLENTAIN